MNDLAWSKAHPDQPIRETALLGAGYNGFSCKTARQVLMLQTLKTGEIVSLSACVLRQHLSILFFLNTVDKF